MQIYTFLTVALAALTSQVAATDVIVARAGFFPAAPAPTTPPSRPQIIRRDYESCKSSLLSKHLPPVPTGVALQDILSADDPVEGHCTATHPLSDQDAIMEYATQLGNWYSSLVTFTPTENCGRSIAIDFTSEPCATATYLFTGDSSNATTTFAVPSNLPSRIVFSDAPSVKARGAIAISFVVASIVLVL